MHVLSFLSVINADINAALWDFGFLLQRNERKQNNELH